VSKEMTLLSALRKIYGHTIYNRYHTHAKEPALLSLSMVDCLSQSSLQFFSHFTASQLKTNFINSLAVCKENSPFLNEMRLSNVAFSDWTEKLLC